MEDIYELREAYYSKHPDGHYFDYKTLKFFGEELSSMEVLEGTVTVTDIYGEKHECYTISKVSSNYPSGEKITYAYFDVETLDDIICN